MDDIPLWEGIGITCCIILSSFFSGAETALTSLTLVKIKQILNELGAKSSSLKLWEQRPNRVLITVLIGNNLANIAASALATNVTYRYFPNKAVAIAVFIMTFIILIFGEIIPKTYARSNADKLVVSIMRVLRFFYYFFYPIHVLLFNFSRLVIILMGGKLPKAQTLTTRDLELLGAGKGRGRVAPLCHGVWRYYDQRDPGSTHRYGGYRCE